MALIPPFFLDCVVSIGVVNQGEHNWFGTGFIVGRPYNDESGEKLYHTFIVTNKHVLLNQSNIVIRFNSVEGRPPLDYPIELLEGEESIWIGHATPEVDVAVFYVNPHVLKADSAAFQFFRMDEHVMSVADMKIAGVTEGDGILFLGFLWELSGHKKKLVIARLGAIARIRDVLEDQESHYLIDASVYPGNSGGPVIIRPEAMSIEGTESINRSALIGMVKSYIPFKDVAVSQQTGNPRVIFEENSGLAWVETLDSIAATVEECYLKHITK